jgi:hypothetical protein
MPSSRKPEAPESRGTNPAKSPRKPYRKPELSSYGDVSQITRGNMSNMPGDAGGAATKMGCWIAEALYGVDTPRTRLVRKWLNEAYDNRIGWAVVVMPLYRRYGVSLARGVRASSLLQRMLRPLFDSAVRRAHLKYSAYLVEALRTSISPSA